MTTSTKEETLTNINENKESQSLPEISDINNDVEAIDIKSNNDNQQLKSEEPNHLQPQCQKVELPNSNVAQSIKTNPQIGSNWAQPSSAPYPNDLIYYKHPSGQILYHSVKSHAGLPLNYIDLGMNNNHQINQSQQYHHSESFNSNSDLNGSSMKHQHNNPAQNTHVPIFFNLANPPHTGVFHQHQNFINSNNSSSPSIPFSIGNSNFPNVQQQNANLNILNLNHTQQPQIYLPLNPYTYQQKIINQQPPPQRLPQSTNNINTPQNNHNYQLTYNSQRQYVPLYCGTCRMYGCQCFYATNHEAVPIPLPPQHFIPNPSIYSHHHSAIKANIEQQQQQYAAAAATAYYNYMQTSSHQQQHTLLLDQSLKDLNLNKINNSSSSQTSSSSSPSTTSGGSINSNQNHNSNSVSTPSTSSLSSSSLSNNSKLESTSSNETKDLDAVINHSHKFIPKSIPHQYSNIKNNHHHHYLSMYPQQQQENLPLLPLPTSALKNQHQAALIASYMKSPQMIMNQNQAYSMPNYPLSFRNDLKMLMEQQNCKYNNYHHHQSYKTMNHTQNEVNLLKKQQHNLNYKSKFAPYIAKKATDENPIETEKSSTPEKSSSSSPQLSACQANHLLNNIGLNFNFYNNKPVNFGGQSGYHSHKSQTICRLGASCKFKRDNKCKYFHPSNIMQLKKINKSIEISDYSIENDDEIVLECDSVFIESQIDKENEKNDSSTEDFTAVSQQVEKTNASKEELMTTTSEFVNSGCERTN